MERERNYNNVPPEVPNESPAIHPLQSCNEEAWEEFYLNNISSLKRSALRNGAQTLEEAEDACQTGFLKFFEGRNTNTFQNPAAYTQTIVINQARDMRRRRSVRKTFTFSDFGSKSEAEDDTRTIDKALEGHNHQSSPEDIAIHKSQMQEVAGALTELSREQQEVILFIYQHGYSQSECAEQLGIPRGAVKTRNYRGLQSLRQILTTDKSSDTNPKSA